ncbi:ADP-ribosylglycohydrolase family protein [soil metagenome]
MAVVLSLDAIDLDDPALIDRAIGALLGLAVGDAIGTTLEFTARDTQPPLVDMVGGGPFGLKPGQWTDDTAMALALADSLKHCERFDAADCMSRFLNWYRNGAYSCTGDCFDIGMATRSALGQFAQDGEPFAGSTAEFSAGNGSLMRLAPVPIWGLKHGATVIAEIAWEQSRTTHGAFACLEACEGFALITARAIAGDSKAAVLAPPAELRPGKVGAVLAGQWRGKTRNEISSSGYVVDSLEAALWCVDQASDFAEAVLLAANLGDDADTVAAITGQLAGALWGASSIPQAWRERVAWGDEIAQTACALLAA